MTTFSQRRQTLDKIIQDMQLYKDGPILTPLDVEILSRMSSFIYNSGDCYLRYMDNRGAIHMNGFLDLLSRGRTDIRKRINIHVEWGLIHLDPDIFGKSGGKPSLFIVFNPGIARGTDYIFQHVHDWFKDRIWNQQGLNPDKPDLYPYSITPDSDKWIERRNSALQTIKERKGKIRYRTIEDTLQDVSRYATEPIKIRGGTLGNGDLGQQDAAESLSPISSNIALSNIDPSNTYPSNENPEPNSKPDSVIGIVDEGLKDHDVPVPVVPVGVDTQGDLSQNNGYKMGYTVSDNKDNRKDESVITDTQEAIDYSNLRCARRENTKGWYYRLFHKDAPHKTLETTVDGPTVYEWESKGAKEVR
jgi:hypothetical protein